MTLNKQIISTFQSSFNDMCTALIWKACIDLKNKKTINTDWGEENISANIYNYIDKSQDAIDNNITIKSEYPFYTQDILDNQKNAGTASWIDFELSTNWEKNRYHFYVEAKNLVEFKYQKSGNKSYKKPSTVQERYIQTGINNIIGNKYPKESYLLGYILNGSGQNIKDAINKLLTKQGKTSEQLSPEVENRPQFIYISQHNKCTIKHLWFSFA